MMHLLHTMHNNMFLETSIKSPFVTFYEFLILWKSVKWNLENEVFCRRALRLIFIFYSTMNSQEVKFKSEQLTICLVAGNNKSSAIVCGFLDLAILRATKYEASTAATFCCWYLPPASSLPFLTPSALF